MTSAACVGMLALIVFLEVLTLKALHNHHEQVMKELCGKREECGERSRGDVSLRD